MFNIFLPTILPFFILYSAFLFLIITAPRRIPAAANASMKYPIGTLSPVDENIFFIILFSLVFLLFFIIRFSFNGPLSHSFSVCFPAMA